MSYPVDIRGVLEALSSSRSVEGELVLPDVELGEQVYRFLGPVRFSVSIVNTGERAVALFGRAEATVSTPCVRCLAEFEIPVTADVDGYYVFPGHDDEIPDEQEVEHISSDLKIDIEPAIVQSLVLELPYAPVHDEACRGICPTCGCDRNTESCACTEARGPSPFDALKDLLDE